MNAERPRGAFFDGQETVATENNTPSRQERKLLKFLKTAIYSTFVGSVVGLGLLQATENDRIHAQELSGLPVATRSIDEPPCDDYGDVDLDGKVTAKDAGLILQNEANLLPTPLNAEAVRRADVNKDTRANTADALSIMQYSAGIIDNFPVCEIQIDGEQSVQDFLDLDMVVLYFDLNDSQVVEMKNSFEKFREWYWRNTCLNVNFNITYAQIEIVIGENSMSEASLVYALANNDMSLEDFDSIYHVGNDVEGIGWSHGINSFHGIGLSHSQYLEEGGPIFPENDPAINYWFYYVANHEHLHVLDTMAKTVETTDMWNPDEPVVYAQREGLANNYEARILRNFFCDSTGSEILAIATRWGEIRYFEDDNRNGLPDTADLDGIFLPVSDTELGPGWNIERYTESIYGVENEHDNVASESIGNNSVRIDGVIENSWTQIAEGESWDGIGIETQIYASWNRDYLYLAGTADKAANLDVKIDADADGIWSGRYNISVNYDYARNLSPKVEGTDNTDNAREFACQFQDPPRRLEDGLCRGITDNNPTYREVFGPIVRDEEIRSFSSRAADGTYTFEFAIPIDYPLSEGGEVGLLINFKSSGTTTVFSPSEVYYFTLE